jgi:hypothetical protein
VSGVGCAAKVVKRVCRWYRLAVVPAGLQLGRPACASACLLLLLLSEMRDGTVFEGLQVGGVPQRLCRGWCVDGIGWLWCLLAWWWAGLLSAG